MARVTAPLLSMKSSGTIGKTLVFGKWRGIDYARQHVIPANPRSTGQTETRQAMAVCTALFRYMGAIARGPWNTFATGQKFTGANAFTKNNLTDFRGATDLSTLIGSPGAKGGPAPSSITITTGAAAGEIDVDYVAPPVPTGWTLVSVQAFATPDIDISTTLPVEGVEDELAAPGLSMTLTGLTAGADYAVTAWLKWTTDQGKTAYSVSSTDVVAAHA